MKRMKVVAFAGLMGALAVVLSVPPLAVPISLGSFQSSIHFFQLAVFLSGILGGPFAGLLTGAIGGLYMGLTKIPFVVVGVAILGGAVGLFARRIRPFFAGALAWLVQAPYVVVTDYVWFTLFLGKSSAVAWVLLTAILVKLTLEAVVCAVLAEIFVPYIRRAGLTF